MAHAKSTDPNVFILPDLGEGVHEAELIAWKVKEGDTVEEHDILAEMETDKALVEVPSPRAGMIKTLHGSEGEILKVGNPLVTYVGGGGGENGSSTAKAPTPAKSKGAPKAEPEPVEEREDAGTVVGAMGGALGGVTAQEGKALATPAVRRLARDMGVDINTVPGSGMGGRVLAKDVKAFAAGGVAPATRSGAPYGAGGFQPAVSGATAYAGGLEAPPSERRAAPAPNQVAQIPPGADTARIPFRGVRRTIANRLRESVNTAVHFTVMDEADVTALDALRKQLAAASGEKVSFLPFVCSAVCRVLAGQFGTLNATVEGEGTEEMTIVQHRAVHMGIATDTESGLMVPVIRDCDKLGVLEIGRQVGAIAGAARSRSIPREQLMGSTFTISNVGSYAGRFATPVINAPEVGILAVGRNREGMVVKDGWFRTGKLMPLSLACDHRVVDGATAALALAEIVRLLQDPNSLLTPARG
ncbi:MAG: dihydrolipoamide acetyltransferase family protein [Phycisphaerales bacterium]